MKLRTIPIVALQLFLISCKVSLPRPPETESDYHLTTTPLLQENTYIQTIEEFYEGGEEGSFIGEDELIIYFKTFLQHEPGGAAIMISSGRTEAAIKYKELIFDLYHNGYSVYIHDHRGQGQSGRLVADPEMGYIDSFRYYVDDMKRFYDRYVRANHHEKVFLMAHSMGGAIGMTYLEQYPGDFDAAAFSSPMLGLKWYVCPVSRLFSARVPRYGPGQTGYNREEEVFKGNPLTGSEIRFRRMVAAYDRVPSARLGGASIQWVRSSCGQFSDIFRQIHNITTPFILFSAENEQIVNPYSHQRFVKKALQQGIACKAYLVEGARHELFVEKDEQRSMVLNTILDFFSGQ